MFGEFIAEGQRDEVRRERNAAFPFPPDAKQGRGMISE
jgi:hypothetical protein